MRMITKQNEITVLVIVLLCVNVLCVDDQNKVHKVDSCYDAELDPPQWDDRATLKCGDSNLYHCVEDENGQGQMYEFCRDPVNIQRGYFPTYSDDVDRIISKRCRRGFFQPRSVDSSDINSCRKWSVCDEMAQLVCREGTTTKDRSCKCDYTAGYVISMYGDISSNDQTCCPDSDTTCKCWEKSCPAGQKLNSVYQCTDISPCKSGFFRPNGSEDCVPIVTVETTKKDSLTTPTSTLKTTTETTTETTKPITTFALKPDDTVIKNIAVTLSVGLFIGVLIMLVVIWFCCPKVKGKVFCVDVKEEEIEDELGPTKKFKCYWPCSCFEKPAPVNRASSRDLNDLQNPEEGIKLTELESSFNRHTRSPSGRSFRDRRLSSSMMNVTVVRETPSSPHEEMFRPRSNTLDDQDYLNLTLPSTPLNSSNWNIKKHAVSPVSKATSIRTNKSRKKTTRYCGCCGWEETEPLPENDLDSPNGNLHAHFSYFAERPARGTDTAASPDGHAISQFDTGVQLQNIPKIEVRGSNHSLAAADDVSVEVDDLPKENREEDITPIEDDPYKYENFPELFNANVHERIGIVTVHESQGTGFRVGKNYVMTTYDLFENSTGTGIINKIWKKIIALLDSSQPVLEIEDLEKCFNVKLTERHKYSSRPSKIWSLLNIWITNNSPGYTFTDVANVFVQICPDIAQGITEFVNDIWNAEIQFGFHKEGESSIDSQFSLDSDIPFYSDKDNIILLKLSNNTDIPPRFYLSMESDIEVGMHLLGHPNGEILKIDPLCHIYMGDHLKNDLKSDTEKARDWCENNFDKWSNNDETRSQKLQHLSSQYNSFQHGDDIVFNCSRSIVHDAAGCVGIVMNQSWPEMLKVQAMLLSGHPRELLDFAKNYDQKKEKVKLFFEKGITMKKVFRLLSNSKVIHLRDDLFAKYEVVHKEKKRNKEKTEKKKKKGKEKHIHHHHTTVIVKDSSNVIVGPHGKIVNKGQVDNRGEVPVHSDIEEESDSQLNKDDEDSGTNGDNEGNSDESSEESFQGFITSKTNKSEKPRPTNVISEKVNTQDSNTPKKVNINTSSSHSPNERHRPEKGEVSSSKLNHSGHTESMNGPYSVLMETIKEQGMRIRGSIPKDGNCFFHAVVDQHRRLNLSLQNLDHRRLRSQVVWYLRNLPEEQLRDVKGCVEGSWDEYLTKMERDGEYADHVIIEYTAKYLKREILIVTSSPESKNAKRENIIINTEDAKNGCPFLLGHVYENHYESLEMKDEDENQTVCEDAEGSL